MQTGPGAAGVIFAAEQRQGKVCIRQLQTHAPRAAAVDADKGRHVPAAHREGIDLHHFAAGQGDALARFFQRQKALQGHKVEGVDAQITTGAGDLAQGALAVQRQGAGRASENFQLTQTVVDHHIGRASCAGHAAVDLHAQLGGAEFKVVHPDKAHRAGCGLERGEAAPGRLVGQTFSGQSQTKVHALKLQAHGVGGAALDAGKCVNATAAHGEQVGLNGGGGPGQRHVVRVIAVIEVENLGAFFNGKGAAGLEEAKHIEIELTGSTQQLALRTVHGHLHLAAGGAGHRQRGLANAGVLPVRVLDKAVVHHCARWRA